MDAAVVALPGIVFADGNVSSSEMKRLKQLEEENQRLKKLVADLSLDKEML